MSFTYHAAPHMAFRGRPLTLQLVVADGGRALSEIRLHYKARTQSFCPRLFPTDGYTDEETYSVYSVRIPAEHLVGDSFSYAFSTEGKMGESYTVPLAEVPTFPPLMLVETGTEMWGEAHFLKLCNPGEREVDLYDYELLLVQRGKIEGRNPLSDAPGVNVLAGGAHAVLRYVTAARLNKLGCVQADVTDMLRALAEFYPAECGDLPERSLRIFTVMHATYTGEHWEALAGTYPISQTFPHHLYLVPRGKDVQDSLYTLAVNCDRNHRDVAARSTVLWRLSDEDPRKGVRLATKCAPSLLGAAMGQVYPFLGDSMVPAILPLYPRERFFLSRGDLPVRFVTFPQEVGEPAVCVLSPEGERCYTATLDEKGVWEAVIPAADLLKVDKQLSFRIRATGRCYAATLGTVSAPKTVRLIDNAGPMITSLYPADGQAVEGEPRPLICVSFADASGVDSASSAFCLDGRNVGDGAKWTADSVSFQPQTPLSLGEHVLELTLRDTRGNRTYRRTSFHVTDGKELHCYRGEVHSHTMDSDGLGTPDQAMRHARDVGKADFFAVTDHCCYMSEEDLARQRKIADSYNENGKFATLYGYELSWSKRGFWGHMNVLGSDWFMDAGNHPMPAVFEKLESDPLAIAMFNHPCDNWGDFDSFAGHTPELDRRLNLIEVKNATYDEHYAAMLTRGWHAAPVVNGDNHNADWITKNSSSGVVLAHSLTRENVMDAMRRGRTYATMDNTMKIKYRVNGEWLGSRLQKPKTLDFDVKISTERPEGIGEVMIVAEDNIVVARVRPGVLQRFSWSVQLPPRYDYYYVKIVNADVYTVTAPVFVEGEEGIAVSDLVAKSSECPDTPYAVCATVQNVAGGELADVLAHFYLTPTGGLEEGVQSPFRTVQIGRLGAGKTHTVTALFPNVAANRRVSVVVSGTLGKQKFTDTRFLLLTPALISKICPLTSPCGEVENPFSYVELYNPTCAPLELSGYVLNGRHEQGNFRPLYRVITPLDGFVLPAKERMIVWCRPQGSTLTAADFNTRYGTFFAEGKDLLITEEPLLQADENGHTLDFCLGEEHLARATYGDFCGGALPVCDMPDCYRYRHDITIREERFSPSSLPQIGEVSKEQMLAVASVPCEQVQELSNVPEREKGSKKTITPVQAANFMANAFNTFRELFSDKD